MMTAQQEAEAIHRGIVFLTGILPEEDVRKFVQEWLVSAMRREGIPAGHRPAAWVWESGLRQIRWSLTGEGRGTTMFEPEVPDVLKRGRAMGSEVGAFLLWKYSICGGGTTARQWVPYSSAYALREAVFTFVREYRDSKISSPNGSLWEKFRRCIPADRLLALKTARLAHVEEGRA